MTDSHVNVPSRRAALTRARAGRWVLAVTVTGAALALGSLHTQVLCVVAVALAVSVGLLWWGAEPMRLRPSAKILLGVCAGLTAYTALQAVPMPASWLAVIAPKNADVWARCLSPLHEAGPTWVTLSLDPIATKVQVLRGVVYGLALLAGLKVASRTEGALFLQRALVIAGVLIAVAAVLHPAFGAHKVFGVYQPKEDPGTEHLAPLLNSNHLAAFLNIAFCVGLASAVSPSPFVPRVLLSVALALLAATQLWVASRGGALAFVLGGALVVTMSRSSRRFHGAIPRTGLLVTLSLAAALGMIFLASSETAVRELTDTSATKLQFIKQALIHMVPAYPVFGVGRGAFESTFAEFAAAPFFGVMTHPEDFPVQWLSEWGAPLTLVAFGSILFALRPSIALARSVPAIGAWCALVAGGAQNLVDFSSEVPAIVLALVLCAAMVSGGVGGANEGGTRPLPWFHRFGALSGAVALAALSWTLPGLGHMVSEDRSLVYARSASPTLVDPELSALIRDSMLRHPAEPYFPYAGGVLTARGRKANIMPWIERTLERAPVYPPAHLLLARWLRRRSPSQARLEYRISIEQSPDAAGPFAQEAAGVVANTDDAMEVVPAPSSAGLVALDVLSRELRARLPATSVALDRELLARKRDAEGPLRRAAEDAILDLADGDGSPWCMRDHAGCVRAALDLAKRVSMTSPMTCDGQVLEARVHIAAGEAAVGLDALRVAADNADDRVDCLRKLAVLACDAQDDARTTDAIQKLSHAGCGGDAECVENLVTAASIEERRGNQARALLLYEKAGERSPDRDDLLELVATRASRAGLHALALDSYRTLSQRHPSDKHLKDAITAEQQATLEQAVRH